MRSKRFSRLIISNHTIRRRPFGFGRPSSFTRGVQSKRVARKLFRLSTTIDSLHFQTKQARSSQRFDRRKNVDLGNTRTIDQSIIFYGQSSAARAGDVARSYLSRSPSGSIVQCVSKHYDLL